MKKPKIEINEIGAMGPDGLEFKIGDNITLYCKRYAEAQVIEEMLDALIECYHLIKALKQTPEWGVNVVKYDEENVIETLEKAGVKL